MASVVGETFFGLDLSKISSNFSRLRRRVSKRVLLIECGVTSINLAEVKVQDGSISLDHIRRYPLPEEAMERGIPTEPAQMAALIKGHCLEEDISVHRAAVVIPSDAAFTTLVQLPAEVAPADALAYALHPSSSVQVPIQLDQTDAELIPLDLPQTPPGQRYYFLAAVPRKLVDRVLETIRLADLELLRLQIGTMSQIGQLRDVISTLDQAEVALHVELMRECSLLSIVTASGPIKIVRLTAIREFPEPDVGAAQLDPSQPISTEQQIVASDRYLPLSELDIRRLAQELKQTIQQAELQFPWIRWRSVILAGPSSAHPLLADLLQEAIGLQVELCRSMAIDGVGLVELRQPIHLQRLGRLVGLGLSFLEQSHQVNRYDLLDGATTQVVATSASSDYEPTQLDPPSELTAISVDLVDELPTRLEDKAAEAEIDSEWLSTSQQDSASSSGLDQLPALDVLIVDDSPALIELSADQSPTVFLSSTQEYQDTPQVSVTADAENLVDFLRSSDSDDVLDLPLMEPMLKNSNHAPVDESPFSMGDLLSSFEAKQSIEPDELDPIQYGADDAEHYHPEPDSVHLVDDPSLWPTAKNNFLAGSSDNSSPE